MTSKVTKRASRGALMTLLAMVIAIAGFGFAVAQDGDASNAETTARRRAGLSSEQQLAEAAEIRDRGGRISDNLTAMLSEARREGDIIRVTCVNDKLTQVNAYLRSIEQRAESLDEAAGIGDEGRRNHEFTVLSVLGQHLTTLEQEAAVCVGQSIFETGTTRIVLDVDPVTPEEDMTVRDLEPPSIPFIPPPGSPTM